MRVEPSEDRKVENVQNQLRNTGVNCREYLTISIIMIPSSSLLPQLPYH